MTVRNGACFAVAGMLLSLMLPGSHVFAQTEPQRVTLYSRMKYGLDGYGRAAFDFKEAIRSDHKDWRKRTRNQYHLLYGNHRVSGENDWLAVTENEDGRDRIKDIGEVEWADLCCATPLPTPPRGLGGVRIPSRGESFESSSEQRVTKAVKGHMYVVHVKNKSQDFYVMLRVEELEPGDHCTISWKLMPSPE